MLLIDSSEAIDDIRIKFSSCWSVLGELGADKSNVLVVLTKYENNIHPEKIIEIEKDLEFFDSHSYIFQRRLWDP